MEITPESPETPAPAPPAPILQGSFAMYAHQGGYLIAWKKRGESETRHLPLPAMILNMAAQMSGKSVEEIVNEFAASVAS